MAKRASLLPGQGLEVSVPQDASDQYAALIKKETGATKASAPGTGRWMPLPSFVKAGSPSDRCPFLAQLFCFGRVPLLN